jgi:hypothetical protein
MSKQPAIVLSKSDVLARRPPPEFCKCPKSQTTVERTGMLRCEHCGCPIKPER